MNWQTSIPKDLDLHVMAINKSNSSDFCRIWYNNKSSCPGALQDRDNMGGGGNGAEVVTLNSPSINNQYFYLIAVTDHQNSVVDFVNSGASIEVKNNIDSTYKPMTATVVSQPDDFYFFGCLEVYNNGSLVFKSAPDGTFFNGDIESSFSNWLSMRSMYC